MMWSLEGKSAVCLAGSQGLGLGIATEMVSAGARTILVSRNPANLERASARIAEILKGEGPRPGVAKWHPPETLSADLRDAEAAAVIMEQAAERLGGIDILINNIGGPPPGTFAELPPESWEKGYDLLVGTYVRQFREALPWLRKSESPRVLTVTSISARQPIAGLLISNTFRAGLVGLTKSLAQEYGPEGILINNLAPGMFDTERLVELDQATAKRQGLRVEEVRRQRVGRIPLGRLADPRELGRVAAFLASPANSYITGQTLLVDGGLYGGL